jgi:hypothetical protein
MTGSTVDADRSEIDRPEIDTAPPAWLDLTALVAGLAVALVGTIGLAAAIAGVFAWWWVVPVGLAGTAALLWWCRGVFGGVRSTRVHRAAVLAVLIALGSLVWNAWAPAQHMLLNRDPGVYSEVARWLDREGTLEVDRSDTPFADLDVFSEAALYDSAPGVFEFQFNHLSSVVLSSSYGLGGARVMWRTPALAAALGLLALYSVTMRATRRPYVSLLAPAAFALTMPFIAVARDTYSENFVVLLLWSGLLAALIGFERMSWRIGIVAGLLLGSTVGARVDSLIYFAALFPIAALVLATGARSELRRRAGLVAAVVAGAAIPLIVGTIDLVLRSGEYHNDLSTPITQMRLLAAASAVGSAAIVVLARWQVVADLLRRHRVALAYGAAGALGVLLFALWLIRPLVQDVYGPNDVGLVGGIQAREGEPVDPDRFYSEWSLHWMAWYLGPIAIAAALAGAVLTTYRSIRRRVPPAALLLLGILLVAGVLYWWRPSIIPDHIWAMRRFVPAVLPALSAMVAVTVAALLGRMGGSRQRVVARVVAAVVVVGALAGPAIATWPVKDLHEQFGYQGVIEDACELIGDDAAVLVIEGPAWAAVPQAFRSWCGVPVSSVPPQRDPAFVTEYAQRWADEGKRLVLVATHPDVVEPFEAIIDGPALATRTATNDRLLEHTLTGRPDEYLQESLTLYVVPVAP